MKRTKVVSTNVASIGYDSAALILEVEFKSGDVYQYDDVPADVASESLNASSIGRYLNQHIKTSFAVRKL